MRWPDMFFRPKHTQKIVPESESLLLPTPAQKAPEPRAPKLIDPPSLKTPPSNSPASEPLIPVQPAIPAPEREAETGGLAPTTPLPKTTRMVLGAPTQVKPAPQSKPASGKLNRTAPPVQPLLETKIGETKSAEPKRESRPIPRLPVVPAPGVPAKTGLVGIIPKQADHPKISGKIVMPTSTVQMAPIAKPVLMPPTPLETGKLPSLIISPIIPQQIVATPEDLPTEPPESALVAIDVPSMETKVIRPPMLKEIPDLTPKPEPVTDSLIIPPQKPYIPPISEPVSQPSPPPLPVSAAPVEPAKSQPARRVAKMTEVALAAPLKRSTSPVLAPEPKRKAEPAKSGTQEVFTLLNGERIMGEVLKYTEQDVVVRSPSIGILTIPKTHLAKQIRTLMLLNGDRIIGEVIAEDNGSVYVRHVSLGTLTIPKSQMAPKVVEAVLHDGSRVCGEVQSETNGVTVIRSSCLGNVCVQSDKVR